MTIMWIKQAYFQGFDSDLEYCRSSIKIFEWMETEEKTYKVETEHKKMGSFQPRYSQRTT